MPASCAAVDWGTSSFRIWLLERDGRVVAGRRSDEGMLVARPDGFGSILETHLASLGAADDLPVVICGMAGARGGWSEAPYLQVEAPLSAVAKYGVTLRHGNHPVLILPGVSQAEPADVMRGEETQLLGAFSNEQGKSTACLPGTHSKWVATESGSIVRFRTYMTGELFAAVNGHTILAGEAGKQDDLAGNPVFEAGLRQAMAAPHLLTSALFSIRARQLLSQEDPGDAPFAISGLLIGTELASAVAEGFASGEVVLVASGRLGEAYAFALGVAGIRFRGLDAEKTVIAGLHAAALNWLQQKGEPQ